MGVGFSRDGDVAVLTIDNPPVNAASHGVRAGLIEALARAEADPDIRAIVIACAGSTFVAGADVREFGQPPRGPFLTEVCAAIEATPKPVVAALHGTALGGGFEIALAAHARVALATAQVGLPEVKLGLIPGAGGTQRLPRLTGMSAAVDIASSGRRVGMAEAQALGMVDKVVEADLLAAAIDHARSMADAPPAGPSHMATGGQVGDCVPPPLTPPHKGEGDLTTAFPDKNGDDLRSKRLQAGSPLPCGEGSGVGVASNASAMPARRGRGGPKGRSGGSPSPYAIPHVAIRRTGGLAVEPFDADAVEAQIAAIERKARGQISPGRAARMVRQAADLPFAEGLARERAAFLDLLASDQAGALRHVFAAERLAGKVPGLDGVEPAPIRTVGVVGAGLMGAGIAACFADAGYAVRVVERDGAAMQAGRGRIAAFYERQIQSGRIDRTTADTRLTRLSFSAERAGLADCDLVVEAVFDELAVKQELFAALSGIVRPDALLATNTSYLDPDAIASVVANPERVLGLHFFSPANVMRLVEVVRAAKTAPRALATGLAMAKRLGKLGIVSGVCEGFVGNRIFTAYRRACDFMLQDGALPHEIDAALEGWGFAMGPYAVNDLAGLDISWARRKRQAATRDPAERYVSIADRLCEAGRLGRKSGKGYYAYEDGRRTVDPIVTDIVEAASREKGIVRRSIPAEEIVGRVLATMADEGKKILDEGIALRASDIDLVLINGYGFPAWRGGPMYLAGHR